MTHDKTCLFFPLCIAPSSILRSEMIPNKCDGFVCDVIGKVVCRIVASMLFNHPVVADFVVVIPVYMQRFYVFRTTLTFKVNELFCIVIKIL